MVSAEQRLQELGVALPEAPKPLGSYSATVQTGNLLFLSGMLPLQGLAAGLVGRIGEELSVEQGRQAARLAALNALALIRHRLGSLDRVTRLVRLGVSIATTADFREHAKVADGASQLFSEVFGPERLSTRTVFGVLSLPLGLPVSLELVLEVREA